MLTPSTNSPVEFLYNTKQTDQEAGLNAAVAYGQEKGWELVCVMWVEQDKDSYHGFNIIYNP